MTDEQKKDLAEKISDLLDKVNYSQATAILTFLDITFSNWEKKYEPRRPFD